MTRVSLTGVSMVTVATRPRGLAAPFLQSPLLPSSQVGLQRGFLRREKAILREVYLNSSD